MWKLTIEDDEGKQTSLPLAHDEYGVGRGENNAIRLTDRNVSRRHAVLKKNAQGWVIRDLQSYNGTYVNGNRVIGEQHLATGDVVQLGDYRLEIVDEAFVQAPTPAPESGLSTAPAHQRPDWLVVVVGPQPGTEYPLNREHFTIGRAEDANISINHASISRLHAELIALGHGRYEIVDKQSANGIRINGVELKRGILEAGDALELGDVRLRFVGAGKIFRAGADQSQQLAAVNPLESMAPSVRPHAPVEKSGGVGKLIGIGIAVGALAVLAILVVVMKSPAAAVQNPTPPKPAPAMTPDAANQIIADAKAAAAKGDLDGAHEKIKSIPDGSAALGDPAVADIEGKWAEMMFGKVDQATEPGEKRKLLNAISTSPNVDAERRKKAADMIAAIDAATPDPIRYPQPPYPGGIYPAGSLTGTLPVPSASTPKPGDSAAAPAGQVTALNDYDQQRKRLEPKVWSGRASEEEIRLLKAICSHMSDRVCRDRANAMLKKKLEQSN